MSKRSIRPCRLTPPRSAVACSATALSLAAAAAGSSFASTRQMTGPGVVNHAVHVIPSLAVTIPEGWPLDNGAITCKTCHTEIPKSMTQAGPYLREFESPDAQPTEFCAKCHTRTIRGNAKSLHWLALGEAHILRDDPRPRVASSPLEPRTRQCLSCHDGVNATESGNATPLSRSRAYLGDKRRNHPIGVEYGGLSRPKDLSPLRPAALLPECVTLPDGKVECISCHNLFAGDRYLLSVPVQRSELCLTCHDLG